MRFFAQTLEHHNRFINELKRLPLTDSKNDNEIFS